MRLLKLISVLLLVIIVNIVILSPSMLGIQITSDNVLEKSVGLTVLIISAVIVIYVSCLYLFGKGSNHRQLQIEKELSELSLEERMALYRQHKLFPYEVNMAIDQINRMKEKKTALQELLGQRFQQHELSYNRFLNVINGVEKLFNMNVQALLNKLHGSQLSKLERFDQRQAQQFFSSKVMQQKKQLYVEYKNYIQGYVSANEEILTKLDRLLLEMTLLNSSDFCELDQIPGMQEINLLIEQTKYYKH